MVVQSFKLKLNDTECLCSLWSVFHLGSNRIGRNVRLLRPRHFGCLHDPSRKVQPIELAKGSVFSKAVSHAWEEYCWTYLFQLPENSVTQTDVFTLEFSLPSCAVGLAYLWETTPVLTMRGLPIYQMGLHKLPGAPWVRAVAWTLPKNVYTLFKTIIIYTHYEK